MGKITIENAALTVMYDDQAYDFGNIQSVNINNPLENKLSGSPQNIGDGLSFKEGVGQPVTLQGVVREISNELRKVLKLAHSKVERIDINLS